MIRGRQPGDRCSRGKDEQVDRPVVGREVAEAPLVLVADVRRYSRGGSRKAAADADRASLGDWGLLPASMTGITVSTMVWVTGTVVESLSLSVTVTNAVTSSGKGPLVK